MTPASTHALHSAQIFRRTTRGQAEALNGVRGYCDRTSSKLLLMVNGYTPMDTLLDMAPHLPDAQAAVSHLLHHGLIESVDPETSPPTTYSTPM